VFGGVERWLNGINPHQAMPVDLCRLKRGTGREDFGGGSWWCTKSALLARTTVPGATHSEAYAAA
jgi:hypothetical protein